MTYSVYTVAAAEFMAVFYGRLLAGDTISGAVTVGRGRLFEVDLRPSPKGGLPLADWIVVLTPRQRQVLALMAEGRTNTAIAHRLVLTEKAVARHVSHIYDELGLAPCPEDHRRVLAVIHYLTH